MTKQDWRNEEDYRYTEELDDAGWAWEFLRRSQAYHDIYFKETSSDYERSQAARAVWALEDLYDPDQKYSPNIRFHAADPFPIISGFSSYTFDPMLEDSFPDFPELLSVDEMVSNHLGDKPPDVIVVALRAGKSITRQMDAVKEFLERHQSYFGATRKKIMRVNVLVFTRYLRMLDAECDVGNTMTQSKKIEIIDPHKTWIDKSTGKPVTLTYRRPDTEEGCYASENQVSVYASDTLRDARALAERGYRGLIRDAQFGF